MIVTYCTDRRTEVVAIVEGLDAVTGGVMQARHSYTTADIRWDCTFQTCVSEDQEGSAIVDFDRFHEVVPVPGDTECIYDAASLL